ncbi:SMP-30/gluconolactonase/LRE family protein [Herbaspirillum sp. RV1423]|uniref:SMP-30/gluconolactonase/LRE family protein n=1 Tax=Herbaspirillum sp. RV1423 TaxID=1443993 RepID=UPI0004BB549A|nr:SMP-30/gluconolactonase/LRE family protein [Herbaspirillum sp. RV1423]
MNAIVPACVWPVGAELGESPVWHAREQALYFVDIKGRAIHRCAADGSRRQTWSAPRQPGFILPRDDGDFVCGLQGGLHRFRPADGSFTLMCKVEEALPGNRINDGFVDPHGRLWFGTMNDAETHPSGALYRWAQAGEALPQDRGYVITNGPAMSPDGRTLYHTDTLQRTVYAFDVDAAGELSRKRPFVNIVGTGYPDGMAVDAEGFVWIALFGGGRIERFSPSGELAATVSFPCANITKPVFGGEDLRTVHVTTAWKGLSPEERTRQPLAGGIFSFRTDTPGLAQHRLFTGVQQ